jgi:peptidoglycan/xylan/chitin deacetylase (PgdA/CDA1 family)
VGTISPYLTISTPRQAVLVTFDDAITTEYTQGFTYLQSIGMRATLFVITSLIDTAGYWTSTQLGEAYAAGWDLSNHTSDHTYFVTSGSTQGQMETKLSAAQSALDGWGFTRASRHVAYPGGEHNATSDAAMTATGMLSGRTVQNGNFYIPGLNRKEINSRVLNPSFSLASAIAEVADAITNEKVCCLCVHGLVASGAIGSEWTISDFRALMDYINGTGVSVLTISELAARSI